MKLAAKLKKLVVGPENKTFMLKRYHTELNLDITNKAEVMFRLSQISIYKSSEKEHLNSLFIESAMQMLVKEFYLFIFSLMPGRLQLLPLSLTLVTPKHAMNLGRYSCFHCQVECCSR